MKCIENGKLKLLHDKFYDPEIVNNTMNVEVSPIISPYVTVACSSKVPDAMFLTRLWGKSKAAVNVNKIPARPKVKW